MEIIGALLTGLLMFIGILGSILPGLPSTPIVFFAAFGHRLFFGIEGGVGNNTIIILFVLMIVSVLLDWVAGIIGAKKWGATKLGIIGTIAGGIIGIFFGIPGLILGPFIGAFLFEFAGGRSFEHSGKAGFGAVVGIFAGAFGKLTCSIAMTGIFFLSLIL
ncbi:MAG TPA: DUF456 domain-containing protein [Verrucomicrobiales bacterium]|jgi:hypothetical protein|nr:DUF456 domain-containing protein [Verrucomicrobiales bacterium]HIL70951.1 DUF456 domain-containing protein [Verrucomicrobiota bacterium]